MHPADIDFDRVAFRRIDDDGGTWTLDVLVRGNEVHAKCRPLRPGEVGARTVGEMLSALGIEAAPPDIDLCAVVESFTVREWRTLPAPRLGGNHEPQTDFCRLS